MGEETSSSLGPAGDSIEAKVRSRALRVLARREKSRHGLETLLRRAGFPATTVATVCLELQRTGLVDDRRFCRLYLGGQLRLRPRSVALFRRDLRREGIEPSVIDRVVLEMGEELDEVSLALSAARKKLRQAGGDLDRLRRLLRARGFSRPVIEGALKALRPAPARFEEADFEMDASPRSRFRKTIEPTSQDEET